MSERASEQLIHACACACAAQFTVAVVVAIHFALLLLLLTYFAFPSVSFSSILIFFSRALLNFFSFCLQGTVFKRIISHSPLSHREQQLCAAVLQQPLHIYVCICAHLCVNKHALVFSFRSVCGFQYL